MKNFLTNYPALRAGLYAVIAGALSIGAVLGFVTQDQVDAVLANVGLALGAVASVLALLNINKRDKPEAAQKPLGEAVITITPQIDVAAFERAVQQLNFPVAPTVSNAVSNAVETVGDIVADTTSAADDFRKQLEVKYGHYLPKSR